MAQDESGPVRHAARLPIGGIVLCGGKSSRMGRPKALLDVRGRTMLEHVVAILADVVEPIVVVAAPDQNLPNMQLDAALRIVHDEVAFQGPLQGIAQGLESLCDAVGAAYVSAVDVPLLQPAWIRFLHEQLGEADVAVPFAQDRAHPLAAIYRCAVAPTARKLLSQQRHRPVFLFDEHPTVTIPEDRLRSVDPQLDSLCNANTPAEYDELLTRLRPTQLRGSS